MKRFTNRNARKYHLIAKMEAGVVLSGAEVKAIKTRGLQLNEAIIQIRNGEAYLVNAVIAPYRFADNSNYDSRAPRKLLLKQKELAWLISKRREKLTIIPLACYTNKRGWIKLQIGLGKTKKKVDKKRELIKRQAEREIKKYL